MTDRAPASGGPLPAPALALVAIVFLETLLLAAGTVYILAEAIRTGIGPMSIALAITVAILALVLAYFGMGLVRRKPRLLGGILTWQVLLIACSILAFQGVVGPAWLGWLFLVPGLAGFALCVSKPIVAIYGGKPKAG